MNQINSSQYSFSRYDNAAIAARFGQAAAIYHDRAVLQKTCADHLLKLVKIEYFSIPNGLILEIGCGTGFVTQGLIQTFPELPLEITDLSEKMVQFCQSAVDIPAEQKHLVSFTQQDGEILPQNSGRYAAIVSSFVIQWFHSPAISLRNWFDQLLSGGFLFLAFPTDRSFSEWRHACEQLNLPFTAQPLPHPQTLLQSFTPAQIRHQETIKMLTAYPSAADFFRELKQIGAGSSQTGQRLSVQQIKHLIQYWDQSTFHTVKVGFEVMFLVVQKT